MRGAAAELSSEKRDDLEVGLNGAPGRNRTRDLRFTKPLLYQLSYRGIRCRLAYLRSQ